MTTNPQRPKTRRTALTTKAKTRVREDGPSRRKTIYRPSISRRTTHGGNRELVKLILEDNQRFRDTLIDLTKRFPVTSTNHEDYESFNSRSPKR